MQDLPQRKTLRLKGYNYSTSGYYFITICTKDRKEILSKIENDCRGEVPPSPAKTKIVRQIEQTIKFIACKYDNIKIDNYIIMPNHVHLIIEKTGEDGTSPLHKIITEIKTYTTKKYNEVNNTKCIKLWQRNYYEHIIRNEKEYFKIIEYMYNNPIRWINKNL